METRFIALAIFVIAYLMFVILPTRRAWVALAAAALIVLLGVAYGESPYHEAPMLAEQVRAGQLPPVEDVPRLVDVIWRIRPLALVAVEAELMRALEIAANKYLGDRVAQVLEHLHEPPAPNGSREPPASKS